MNPYIVQIRTPFTLTPIKRDSEQEAIAEGFAVSKANGFRLRHKGRQMVKTKASRLSLREAA
jgi:hypothetical protein